MMVLSALLIMGVQAFAQNAVSGKVTDASGEPLVGVNVLVKGTTTGAMTDLDGIYALNVPNNATLVFSCIGYATQEIAVAGKKTVNVQLAEDNLFLDDVVVIGYGTARKRDVSGAIASVNYGNDTNVASLPNPNALAALSSKVAGLSYAPTTSAAGDNTQTMTIRGKNARTLSLAVEPFLHPPRLSTSRSSLSMVCCPMVRSTRSTPPTSRPSTC